MYTEVIGVILQNCFPVGIAAFVIVRVECEIKRLTSAIEQLRRCNVCKLGGGAANIES